MSRQSSKKLIGDKWSDYHLWCLRNYLEDGDDYTAIANRMGITYNAVKKKANNIEENLNNQTNLWSVRDLENQFFIGVWDYSIKEWIERGWIKATISKLKRKTTRITHDNLMAFLENPDYWFAWEPSQIRDNDIRIWTQEMRDSHPWKWLTTKEVAKTLGVKRNTVIRYCSMGVFKSAVQYKGAWHVRSDEVKI